MNVLYIIGNGFDLNLNLQTSYEHFFEYYKNQKNDNDIIIKLKENIKGKKKDWSDLELALGGYFKELDSEEEFDMIFDDIKFNLSQFLKVQESNFNIQDVDSPKFLRDLIYPEEYLLFTDQVNLRNYFGKWINIEVKINIATFNYTKILDDLFKEAINKNLLIQRHQNHKVKLGSILHIHGFVEKEMILGVNDDSQILNGEFLKNHYIKASFIKAEFNKTLKNGNNSDFSNKINNANLIIIFGSSLGDSDKIWWERIASRINDECKLIIFKKGPEILPLQEHKLFKYEDQIKNYFMEKASIIDEDKIYYLKERVFVGINTNMFNLDLPF